MSFKHTIHLRTRIIISEPIEIVWSPITRKHYESLGYGPYRHGKSLTVNSLDLSYGSAVGYRVRCPLCAEIRESSPNRVHKAGNTCCKGCAHTKNLLGDRFGKLTVIRIDKSKKGFNWLCKCDCGNTTSASPYELTNGIRSSCGCYYYKEVLPSKTGESSPSFIDISGQKFGKLIAIKYTKDSKWLCICDCGNKTEVDGYKLRSGHTKSCGCLFIESISGENNPFYGVTGSDHPAWNPNLTEEDRKRKREKRQYFEYKKWRNSVFKRDNYTCFLCLDDKGGNLNAHHLYSFNDYPEYRIDIDNGITLCENCHRKFHEDFMGGYHESCTAMDFSEFFCQEVGA